MDHPLKPKHLKIFTPQNINNITMEKQMLSKPIFTFLTKFVVHKKKTLFRALTHDIPLCLFFFK